MHRKQFSCFSIESLIGRGVDGQQVADGAASSTEQRSTMCLFTGRTLPGTAYNSRIDDVSSSAEGDSRQQRRWTTTTSDCSRSQPTVVAAPDNFRPNNDPRTWQFYRNFRCGMSEISLVKTDEATKVVKLYYKAKARMCTGRRHMPLYPACANEKYCKSAITLQCYHPHLSDFCWQPQLTNLLNLIIIHCPDVSKIYPVFLWKCQLYVPVLLFPVSCSIHTVSEKEITWCLIITLANVDRFSKFFHQLICEKILHVYTRRLPSTSPAICCYTLPRESRKSENVTDFDSILNKLLTCSWGHLI